MNVKCLRNFLKDLPDDMEVVTAGCDHTFYETCRLEVLEAFPEGRGYWGEYLSIEPHPSVKKVLVIE